MPSYTIRDLDDFVAASPPGRASWTQVAPVMERPVLSPAFILGDWPAELSYGYYNETKIGPVRCYRLRDVGLMLDGIILAGNEAMATVLVNHPAYHVEALLRRFADEAPGLPVRRLSGQVVMLSGPGNHIYGHWLVDILPRILVLQYSGFDIGSLRYAVPATLPGFCRTYLELLGIGANQIVPYDDQNEILQVEELLAPTNLRFGSQIHPLMQPFVSYMRSRLMEGNTPSVAAGGRRLFVSRRRGEPSRTLTNREQIEAIAVEAGFEIVSPETMTIPEQVSLFAAASEIVGEYGSGLHGSIFAPPGAVIMALRGTSHHPGFIQSGLGQVFRQPTGYQLSSTPIEAVDQHFAVSEDGFRQGLRCVALQARQARERAW